MIPAPIDRVTASLTASIERVLQRPDIVRYLAGGILLALLLVPIVVRSFFVSVLVQGLILGLFAVSVNIALGYVGLLTLAPAVFFGIGAYSVAKVIVDFGGTYATGTVVGVIAASMFAIIIGYAPIRQRITTTYFALFTLALGVIAFDFTSAATEITGGVNGIGFVSYPEVLGVDLSATLPQYYFVLIIVLIAMTGLFLLLRTDYRLILNGIRQNEQRIQYLGYDTDREQMIAWILSCGLSAFAGALYVGTVGLAAPSMVSFDLTGEVIVWIVIGGVGSFAGPFVAAFVLHLLETLLGGIWSEGYLLILGVLFIMFVFLLPEGIAGWIRDRRS
jgi:ABC-type branched-subunit amino acid transport system permease subunit